MSSQPVPVDYAKKKECLLNCGIGIWDVAHSAVREGSLDSAIKNERPNDLVQFIEDHPALELIAFNGTKAARMFKKFFSKSPSMRYVLLPSTSSAHTTMNVKELCGSWKVLLGL